VTPGLKAIVAAAAILSQPDARQVNLANPQVIAALDSSKMQGDFVRLAWSPDGSEFYVQTLERDRHGAPKLMRHYLVSTTDKQFRGVDQEPPWAAKYWQWKSAQASTAAPAFKIDVHERTETKRAVSTPTGGQLARGGPVDPTAGTTVADAAGAADVSQRVKIYSLDLGNQTIGEWANEPVVPGINFSWSPPPMELIVFAKREGGPLIVLDAAGRKRELSGAHAATLPAWSDDGKRLAWLERKDRKQYVLIVADVTVE
jgi:WD40 repeat protein